MADFIFDGTNKIIKEPAGAGDTTFDVARDVYSAWKRWVQSGNGQFESALVVEGGTPIGATGLFTGTTFLLVNGWKIMAADHDHQLILSGNLFSDDGIVSTANPIGQSTVFVNSSVAAQGVASGSAVTAQDKTDIINGVWNTLLSTISTNETAGKALKELWQLQGLDAGNPMVVTQTARAVDDVDLAITGDGETTTTVTRQ